MRGYPTAFLIDFNGKIAFHSDDPSSLAVTDPLRKKYAAQINIDLASTLTAEQSTRLTEGVLGEVIEKPLGQAKRPKSAP